MNDTAGAIPALPVLLHQRVTNYSMAGTFLGALLAASLARILGVGLAPMAAAGGLLCGAIQLYALRRHIRFHFLWLAVTALSWFVGAWVANATFAILPRPAGEVLYDLAGATCVGVTQWVFMRHFSSSAWQFLVLNLIAWAIFWYFSTEVLVGLGVMLIQEFS
jgi:hypothetical protein